MGIADIHVPHEQEEIVQVPVVQHQERIVQNKVEIVVEVPKPQVVERTIQVPKIVIEEKTVMVPKVQNTVVHSTTQHCDHHRGGEAKDHPQDCQPQEASYPGACHYH